MSAAGWNFCQGGGLLTNRRTPMPEDQGEFYGRGRLDLVPCSHLLCGQCGEVVRWVDGRTIPAGASVAAIYESANWRRSELLADTDLPIRAYACRCTAANVVVDALIKTLRDDDGGPEVPWSCGGHPTVRGTLELDGVTVDATTDIEGLVQRVLEGEAPGDPDAPWAAHPAIWVLRLFGRLRGTPLADKVAEAVGEAARSDSVHARSEALTFYLQNPFVAGSDALIDALEEQPELFAEVPAPDAPPGETLEFQVLRILGSRLELDLAASRPADARALSLLRLASLRPGLAPATLPTLSAVDTDWVLRETMAIARAGKDNALAVALWIGINASEHEEATQQSLLDEGLLDPDDL